ncbi:serine/threonine-protein kinase haspin [Spea bombifrons]|uniref:serine/threonine-protein kinase haspin n=1 Tax=Spea bombifrons TaxID=233779 RepID=UPI00234AAC55|nr:serine/threonine-protein kinase haspin [Spea bombifrons]
MAGRGVQGGVQRTYSRLNPVRRVQPRSCFSPGESKNNLFSSSSSLLSSPCEPSSSGDSDFVPSRRKTRIAANIGKKCHGPQKRAGAKRRKKSSASQTRARGKPRTDGEDKEDGPPERKPMPSLELSTPFRRFVTVRRKAPGQSKALQGKLVPPSPDSSGDFQMYVPVLRNKRRLSSRFSSILSSPGDALHSPLQKPPLLSSTPSMPLILRPKCGSTFERQPTLCNPLEESVVLSCVEYPCKVETKGLGFLERTSQCVDPETSPLHHTNSVRRSRSTSAVAGDQHCCSQKMRSESSAQESDPSDKSTSEVNNVRHEDSLKPTASSAPCSCSSFSLILLSSTDSQSVVCIDGDQSKQAQSGDRESEFDATSELFSASDLNVSLQRNLSKDDSTVDETQSVAELCMTAALRVGSPDSQAGRPLVMHPTDLSKDTWTCSQLDTKSVKHLQPFVRLDSESVTKYFKNIAPILSLTNDERNKGQRQSENSILPDENLCLEKMQPVVLLDPSSVARNSLCKVDEAADPGIRKADMGSPALPGNACPGIRTMARTPDLTASQVQNKALSSVGAQEMAGTGRKVCISGFSAKRWGTRQKNKTRTRQELSFQDYEMSAHKFKQDVTNSSTLSSSVLFSSSFLTSSFMNSSAVLNLSLSPDAHRDPHKEHQRWLRLRAALSLHRKKKVESAVLSERPEHQRDLLTPSSLNSTLISQRSSLFLLSPQRLSACEDISDADKVFMECDQDGPIPFSRCLSSCQLRLCQKVGEGVYGEVFKTQRGGKHVALKVIPMEGCQKVNGEDQKSFAEILPEIIISKELSLLSEGTDNNTSGFIKLHSAHCVQGSYPSELLQAWDTYADEKGSENERPDFFSQSQLFMILEFEFGGNDLERMSSQLSSVSVSRSILHQVTAALAIAEAELRFEHRDLHWGNLLIEKSKSQTVTALLDGEMINIPTSGVQVKIIDYTLSRLDKDGLTVFTDLSSDDALFLGVGDLQFSVYRDMKQENKNCWSSYDPHSNILWLHYLADKLLSAVKYVKKPTSVAHRRELRKLQDFRREVRRFSSAAEALRRSKLFV